MIKILRVLEYTFPNELAAKVHLAQRAIKDHASFGTPKNLTVIREAFVGGILGFDHVPDEDAQYD